MPARSPTRRWRPSRAGGRSIAGPRAPSRARQHLVEVPAALDVNLFRQMADMSNDGFYLTDRHGRFLYVNDCSAMLNGYSREELLQMNVADLNPEYPQDRLDEFVASLQQVPGDVPPFETLSQRKDGTIYPIEISVARLDVGGELYMFGVVRDITERKQMEAAHKSFAQRILQTLDAERQRVARELHDEVGQAIATVGVLLHTLEQTPGSVPDEARPALAATHTSIRQITESVARIVRDYHPAELLGLGLEDTLRTHARQFAQRQGLGLRLATIPVSDLLDPEHELHLYRIAQEALSNVARHAQARKVAVRIARRGAQLVLTIRDDGIGFRATRPNDGGLGLVTMRERAELMRAELVIRAISPRGTEMRVVVPLGSSHASPLPAGASRYDAPPAAGPIPPRRSSHPRLPYTNEVADIPAALDLAVFRQMADMSSEAFYLTDSRGRFRYVNERAATLTGYSRAELLTMTLFDLDPAFPRDQFESIVAAVAHGPLPPFEARTLRKDGTYSPTEASVARIEVDGETHLFGVVRDITDRKHMQAIHKSFAQRMLQTLEAERQRVARELHDEVGQAIATVGALLHTIEQTPGSVPEEARPALAATHASIRQITESVAHIVRDYHPAELLGLGLETTLRTHARQFAQRHGLTLQLATIPVTGLLAPEHELHLYRIAQEALANVARHAQARVVTVRIARRGAVLVLTIRDDGIGFDAARAGGGGLGLITMRERADLMRAELVIRPVVPRGTELRVAIPIDAAHEGETRPVARARRRAV